MLNSVPKREDVQEKRASRDDKKNRQEEITTRSRYIARRTEDGEEQIMQGCTYVTRI